jgi:hypothetical protein
MAKIVIDEDDLPDKGQAMAIESMAKFFQMLHDPYQLPDAMAHWLDTNNASGVDQRQWVSVGYGPMNLQVEFTMKKSMIIMEFSDATGMRLMELRLHK